MICGGGLLNLTHMHRAFLKHLDQLNVPYLIIGGQARAYYFGHTTSDLDLWMACKGTQGHQAVGAIASWCTEFPNHIFPPITEDLSPKKNSQVQLPNADVPFLCEDGSIETVTIEKRIDMLFGFPERDFCFLEFYKRRNIINTGSSRLNLICEIDLNLLPRNPEK